MHGSEVRFFKYMSPEAAISALKYGTMRWSSPKLFNDPFDFPVSMDFAFTGEDIAKALTDELVRMTYDSEEPIGDPNNQFMRASRLNRRIKNRPPVEKFKEFMAEANAETIKHFEDSQIQRREFLSQFRNQFAVFCVSEKKDDLLMWAHYAKDHTGVVFQFRCLPELARPLCAAAKVNYVRSYPLIGSLEEYVKHLTGQLEINYDHLFRIFSFTKSCHWAYEEEWRCVSRLHDREAGFDYKPFLPEEFEAIYIGHRALQEHKDLILNRLSESYPNTKLFFSKINIQDYSMAFHEAC